MKIALFSDIHGNQYAMRAFLSVIEKLNINRFIFCGDIYGYYYGQSEVIKSLLRLHNLDWLLGNHDKNFLDAIADSSKINGLSERYGNSYKQALICVNSRDCASILHDKHPIKELNIGGIKIVAVHGTISDPLNGRLYPSDTSTLVPLKDIDVCIMGHTHYRMLKSIGNTLYVNPGSLGQPRDKYGSSFAVLTLPNRLVDFIDLYYDTSFLDAEIRRFDLGNEKLLEILHRSD